MPYRILVVEDDPTLRRGLVTLLEGDGYEARAVTDFTDVVSAVREIQPHLILLDIRLPGESGFALCSQIRAFSQVPIVFVTSSNSDMDELSSILLGGDAFVTKPYHTAILLAKIASLLKRAYPQQGEAALTWREVTLHLDRGQLSYRGQTAELTKSESKILAYLFRHPGTICSRGDLVSYLWDNQVYVDDNALSVHIGRIREKLAGLGLTGFIQTKHRQGYLI